MALFGAILCLVFYKRYERWDLKYLL
jgi:hypothetical protein